MPTFGDALKDSLGKRGISLREFAKIAGNNPGFCSQVTQGKRTPPLERLESWADVLSLKGEERAEFIRVGYLAHAPAQVRSLVSDLEARLDRLERLLPSVVAERNALREEVEDLKKKMNTK